MKTRTKITSLFLAIALVVCSVFALGSVILASGGNPSFVGGAYQIDDAADLDWFRTQVNNGNTSYNAKLTADITLTGTWTPIGNVENRAYAGTFDGNGKTVSGLLITSGSHKGLFGWIGTAGTVKNVTVYGSVSGAEFLGGIAGRCDGKIESCINYATVTGSGEKVGGIVGVCEDADGVYECKNFGDITGYAYVGGIVGGNFSTQATSADPNHFTAEWAFIKYCANHGTVEDTKPQFTRGVSRTGGIAGHNNGLIEACYNTGAVSGKTTAGIAGTNYTGWNWMNIPPIGEVKSCYNIGTITTKFPNDLEYCHAAPLVEGNEGYVTNCYYLDTTSTGCTNGIYYTDNGAAIGNYGNPTSGGASLTSGGMQATTFVANLNNGGNAFVTAPAGINNGYPILSWE